ncbi:ankyrin repeat domain-containing protein [archaeon]|nr:ankyrin repeat domain-containing protein [archaeon]
MENQKLMTAVLNGNIDEAISAIENGASIHIKTTKGNSLLYVAASRKQEEMFDWLLEVEQDGKKINLDTQNNMGATILLELIREDGSFEYSKKILNLGANPDITSNDGMSPLIQSCSDKKFDEVQLLLQYNVDYDYAIPHTKTTAFLMAASQNSLSICETLKEAGADVNALNSSKLNALLVALMKTNQFMKKKEIIEYKSLCLFLSDIGIDVEYVAPSGANALWFSSLQKNKELTEHLLNKGVNADVWHEIGLEGKVSVLDMWMDSKEFELVRKLHQNGAKFGVKNENGNNAEALGFLNPSVEMRELVLDLGGDVNSVVQFKQPDLNEKPKRVPIISIVIEGGNNQRKLVKRMIDGGAKLTFEDESEQESEPIMLAIYSNAYDIVSDLLNTKQINVNRLVKVNKLGSEITPLMLTVSGSQNKKFDEVLARKKRYEKILKAKEENDKNGIKSKLIDDEGIEEIKQTLEQLSTLEFELKSQKKQIFDTLIANGANVEIKNKDGRTAIYFVSSMESATWLKDVGVNMNVIDNDGNNPLLYSIINNKKELMDFMKEEYADKQKISEVFYQLAFTKVDSHLQQSLLENGILNYIKNDIDLEKMKDKDVKFNIENINYQDEDGNTGILVACANDLPFLVSLYFKLGANINLSNNNNETPLMHAISTGNTIMVNFLIENKAKTNEITKDGKSVLDFAEELGNKEIIEKIKISLANNIVEDLIPGVKKLKN